MERSQGHYHLNRVEEEDLAKFVELVADIGFERTRKEIKAIVQNTALEKQILKREKISDGLFERFWNANPNLACGKAIILQLLD